MIADFLAARSANVDGLARQTAVGAVSVTHAHLLAARVGPVRVGEHVRFVRLVAHRAASPPSRLLPVHLTHVNSVLAATLPLSVAPARAQRLQAATGLHERRLGPDGLSIDLALPAPGGAEEVPGRVPPRLAFRRALHTRVAAAHVVRAVVTH